MGKDLVLQMVRNPFVYLLHGMPPNGVFSCSHPLIDGNEFHLERVPGQAMCPPRLTQALALLLALQVRRLAA